MQQVLFSTHYFSFEQDNHGVGFVRGGNEVLVVPLAENSDVILAVDPRRRSGNRPWSCRVVRPKQTSR